MWWSISGNDWTANPFAPWNEPIPTYGTCPICNGDGGFYDNEDGRTITKDEFDSLEDEEKTNWDFRECEHCLGCGTIELDGYDPSDDL